MTDETRITLEPGELVFIVPADVAAEYAEWTECAAFKIERVGQEVARFRVAPDLESLTDPEGPA